MLASLKRTLLSTQAHSADSVDACDSNAVSKDFAPNNSSHRDKLIAAVQRSAQDRLLLLRQRCIKDGINVEGTPKFSYQVRVPTSRYLGTQVLYESTRNLKFSTLE
eukprot:SAG11_NODE_910_length_6585_cov_7.205520_8_plen_106_part_00